MTTKELIFFSSFEKSKRSSIKKISNKQFINLPWHMHCIIVHPLMHYFFYLYETDLIYNDLNLEDIFQFVTKNVKISFFANLTFLLVSICTQMICVCFGIHTIYDILTFSFPRTKFVEVVGANGLSPVGWVGLRIEVRVPCTRWESVGGGCGNLGGSCNVWWRCYGRSTACHVLHRGGRAVQRGAKKQNGKLIINPF